MSFVDFDRRRFLSAAALGLPLAATTACEFPPATPLEKLIIPPKDKLVGLVKELPSSLIKDLLVSRITPLFEPNPPTTINRAGVDIKVDNSRVNTAFFPRGQSQAAEGFAFMWGDKQNRPSKPLYPNQNTIVYIPLPAIIFPEDRDKVQRYKIMPDGVPAVDISYLAIHPFYEGIRPTINLTFMHPLDVPKQYQKTQDLFVNSTFIKEACVLLATDLLIEEIIRKMREYGLPTHLMAKTGEGTSAQGEIVSHSIPTLQNANKGRLLAAIDLASYVLFYKAIEGTDMLTELKTESNHAALIPLALGANIGNSENDVLYKSMRWAVDNKSATVLYFGNMDRIP